MEGRRNPSVFPRQNDECRRLLVETLALFILTLAPGAAAISHLDLGVERRVRPAIVSLREVWQLLSG